MPNTLISGGKSAYARQNLGVVNDFIERLDSSGGDVRFHFLNQMVQTSGGGVRFNLFVPILPESIMQTMNQIPLFFGRKLFNGRLDFQHCAHVDKVRCKFESASAKTQLESTLQRALNKLEFQREPRSDGWSQKTAVKEMLRLMKDDCG